MIGGERASQKNTVEHVLIPSFASTMLYLRIAHGYQAYYGTAFSIYLLFLFYICPGLSARLLYSWFSTDINLIKTSPKYSCKNACR
ncbi:hypothetical protein BABINDRAFT_73741 [Babjeviella inositovora NRRL Y-12698]|uniref:Uncharacterized protein n=1 Tax=Babjeviella inositovora NRRL Y-12698 TaxID=984486 RepID=A0A1E3QYB3_9ASCO|nr:uncharacterized protein BABINDRAFT_73741 [Babjeviella inositovora NRRL Y-12698]ODQ82584.1 hypothetical protein BABINDRAFT_73741 [Babjeviella inositovora NRRL Y-12698]